MPDEFTPQLAQLFRDVLDQGFLPPLYMAAVSANGSAIVYQCDALKTAPGLEATPLCEHITESVLAYPINVMIVDQTGRAVHVAIDREPAP